MQGLASCRRADEVVTILCDLLYNTFLHVFTHRSLCREYVARGGTRDVEYFYGKSCKSGRTYAKCPCLQNATRLIRNLVCTDDSIDVDIVNCWPVLLEWECGRRGIDCGHLRVYNAKRDELVESGAVDKKKVLVAMLHGAFVPSEHESGFFLQLVSSFKTIHREIGLVPASSVVNIIGSALATRLIEIESLVMSHVYSTLTQYQCNVVSPCHDGAIIRPSPLVKIDDVLREAEMSVLRFEGISIRLVVKPFDPLPTDLPSYESLDIDGADDGFLSSMVPGRTPTHASIDVVTLDRNNPYIGGIQFNGAKVYLLIAPMGAGKTYQLKVLVNTCIAEHKASLVRPVGVSSLVSSDFQGIKKILIISSRVTFSRSMNAVFPTFSHYLDCKNLHQKNHLICQYESLHKLVATPSFTPPDLVICDEIRSIFSCAASISTNKQNLRSNSDVLLMICGMAKKLVMCDADATIDDCLAIFMDELNQPSLIIKKYDTSVVARHLSVTNNESEFLKEIRDSDKPAVMCRAKSDAHAIRDSLVGNGKRVLCITGDSSDVDMHIFDDINTALLDYDACVLTSTVTVGTDITLPGWEVFIHIGVGGCNSREMMQMAGRWRNALFLIRAYCASLFLKGSDTAETRASVIVAMSSKKSVWQSWWLSLCKTTPDLIHRTIVTSPTWLFYLVAEVTTENIKDFLWGILTHARTKNWRVTVHDAGKEKNAEHDALKKAIKNTKGVMFNTYCDLVVTQLVTRELLMSRLVECLEDERQKVKTDETVQMTNIIRCALRYTPLLTDASDLVTAVENSGPIYNARMCMDLYPHELGSRVDIGIAAQVTLCFFYTRLGILI
jgi:hypothetical protein